MQTLLKDIVLPDTPTLRVELAEIIARVCNCEAGPILDDQEFSTVIAQFDSLAVLEILLEIETAYGIETDEMLPVDQETGAQELTSAFPSNLSELITYIHEVAARRPEREAALRARVEKAKGHITTPLVSGVAEVEPSSDRVETPAKEPAASSQRETHL